MITRTKFINIILKEVPDFQKDWSEYLAYWDGKSEGTCLDMDAFTNYVIDLIVNENLKALPGIFTLIERLMVEGDEEVQNVAATCFLESIINVASGGRIDARKFVHLLGPESKAYCQAWDEFTGVSTPGL